MYFKNQQAISLILWPWKKTVMVCQMWAENFGTSSKGDADFFWQRCEMLHHFREQSDDSYRIQNTDSLTQGSSVLGWWTSWARLLTVVVSVLCIVGTLDHLWPVPSPPCVTAKKSLHMFNVFRGKIIHSQNHSLNFTISTYFWESFCYGSMALAVSLEHWDSGLIPSPGSDLMI